MCVFILVWMKESKACEWRRWMLPPSRPSNKSTRLFWLCTNRHWWRPTWVTAQIVRGFTEKLRPLHGSSTLTPTNDFCKIIIDCAWCGCHKREWALPSVVLPALHFPTLPLCSVCVNALIKCIHGQSGCWRTESMTWIVYFHLCLYQTPCSLSCRKTPAYSSLCVYFYYGSLWAKKAFTV